VPERGAGSGPHAVAVRTPMTQPLRHELYCFAARAGSDDTDYATHGRQSSATPALRNVSLAIGQRFV
jgi:hypothetical protein